MPPQMRACARPARQAAARRRAGKGGEGDAPRPDVRGGAYEEQAPFAHFYSSFSGLAGVSIADEGHRWGASAVGGHRFPLRVYGFRPLAAARRGWKPSVAAQGVGKAIGGRASGGGGHRWPQSVVEAIVCGLIPPAEETESGEQGWRPGDEPRDTRHSPACPGYPQRAVARGTGCPSGMVMPAGRVSVPDAGGGYLEPHPREHAAQVGLFFEAPDGALMKVKALAANEPKHLKAIAPATLTAGTACRLVVVT